MGYCHTAEYFPVKEDVLARFARMRPPRDREVRDSNGDTHAHSFIWHHVRWVLPTCFKSSHATDIEPWEKNDLARSLVLGRSPGHFENPEDTRTNIVSAIEEIKGMMSWNPEAAKRSGQQRGTTSTKERFPVVCSEYERSMAHLLTNTTSATLGGK